MTSTLPVTQPSAGEHDYEAIEDAVMQTARGRWFLAEYARRMRAAETTKVLEALARLERALLPEAGKASEAVASDAIIDAVAVIERRLSEIAWSLRERGFDGRTCAEIENQARALKQLAGASANGATSVLTAPPASVTVPSMVVAETVIEPPGIEPRRIETIETVEVASADMPSVAMLNERIAEIRVTEPIAQDVVDSTADLTAVGVAMRRLIEIDAMDDRARARLFY